MTRIGCLFPIRQRLHLFGAVEREIPLLDGKAEDERIEHRKRVGGPGDVEPSAAKASDDGVVVDDRRSRSAVVDPAHGFVPLTAGRVPHPHHEGHVGAHLALHGHLLGAVGRPDCVLIPVLAGEAFIEKSERIKHEVL